MAPPSPTKERHRSFIARLLREPLLHFIVLGAALFVVWGIVNRGGSPAPSARQIVLTLDDLRQLQIAFAAQWHRPPKEPEMLALIENRIKEEVLYREALAMGLDKDDTIVKRRMAQKMQFLAEDVSAAYEPTNGQLRTWFEQNASIFEEPPRITFRTLYFSPDRRGPNARADAEKALARLSGRSATWPGTIALFQEKAGVWTGPIESGYGWHLVFLESVTPARVPAFEEVESDVKTAWFGARKAEAWEEAYRKMRSKYQLLLPAPPQETPAPTPGAAR